MNLAEATLDLVEAWIEKTKREKAVRRSGRVIVRLLRKAWRKQAKAIIARMDLRGLLAAREAVSPAVRQLILRMLLPAAAKASLGGFLGEKDVQAFDSAVRGVMRKGGVNLASQLLTSAAVRGLDLTREETNWIKQHGFMKLAPDVDVHTKDLLATVIGEAYQKGATYEQMVRAIETAGAFDRRRAELIASTELNAAYNQGGLAMARQLGASMKRWDPLGGNVCEDCLANEAESYIPIDDDFSTGDDCPPAHPNCECVLEFSFLEPEQDDEKDAPTT